MFIHPKILEEENYQTLCCSNPLITLSLKEKDQEDIVAYRIYEENKNSVPVFFLNLTYYIPPKYKSIFTINKKGIIFPKSKGIGYFYIIDSGNSNIEKNFSIFKYRKFCIVMVEVVS